MKKTLIILLAVAAAAFSGINASAQASFGLGTGTRLFFEPGEDARPIYGVQLNFEESRRVSDYFGYSAGIDFGAYTKKDYFHTAESLNMTLGLRELYLDIPVRAKFYIPFGNVEMYIFGGPVPSVCLSSVAYSSESTKTSRFREGSDYTRFDVLAGGGIGFEFGEKLRVTAGYDHGLLNRFKDSSVKSGVAKLTASYMF